MRILIPNRITESRYQKVKNLMSGLGSPVISVVEISEGYYLALEGSHRTTAAKELGLIPILQIIDTLEGNPDRERILTEVSVRESRKLGIEFDNMG